MLLWLFGAVMSVNPPAVVVCESPKVEAYTWVQCNAKGVAVWSAQWRSDEDGEPQFDLLTVQAGKRCMWVQSKADHTSQPTKECPDRGTPRWCVLRQTVNLCRK